MTAPNRPASEMADRELVITRILDAPRTLVWRAWTEPEHLIVWWGPRGFTNTFHEFDARPGGVWRFIMHGPDGTDYDNRIIFHEVVAPERLVYSHDSGEDGDPAQFHVTVTFAEQDGKTEITMRSVFTSAEERDKVVGFGAIELGQQTLDRLAEHLTTME